MHISAQLIESYPRENGLLSCAKEKLSIPLEAHEKTQSSEIFLSFQAKKLKSFNFLYFGPSCWNRIFKLTRSRAFNDILLVEVRPRKVAVHTFFWVGPGKAMRPPSNRNYRKPSLFCLTPYAVEISRSNSANRELSNDVKLLEVRQRKVALHTSSHLVPIEVWQKAAFTTFEGCRVSSKVGLENCTQVLGVGQIWRACHSRLRKNSTSHLFWLVRTCPSLSTIQWP